MTQEDAKAHVKKLLEYEHSIGIAWENRDADALTKWNHEKFLIEEALEQNGYFYDMQQNILYKHNISVAEYDVVQDVWTIYEQNAHHADYGWLE